MADLTIPLSVSFSYTVYLALRSIIAKESKKQPLPSKETSYRLRHQGDPVMLDELTWSLQLSRKQLFSFQFLQFIEEKR